MVERRKRPLGLVDQISDFNLLSKNNVKIAKCFKKECWGNIILIVFIPNDHSVHNLEEELKSILVCWETNEG